MLHFVDSPCCSNRLKPSWDGGQWGQGRGGDGGIVRDEGTTGMGGGGAELGTAASIAPRGSCFGRSHVEGTKKGAGYEDSSHFNWTVESCVRTQPGPDVRVLVAPLLFICRCWYYRNVTQSASQFFLWLQQHKRTLRELTSSRMTHHTSSTDYYPTCEENKKGFLWSV